MSPAWLLLQAPRWVLQAGEALRLRCHTWKDTPVQKVQYFWNGQGRQFSYENKEFHIPKARHRHSGSYFCRGMIGTLNVSSQAVKVTVEGEEVQAGGARGPRCHAATWEEAPDCPLASSRGRVTAGAGATCPSAPQCHGS